MRSISKFLTTFLFIFIASTQGMAQLHPMESLGREIFDCFRGSKFSSFYNLSVFSLNENTFKSFLFGIRNKSIRDDLISLHKQNFPEDSTFDEKWKIAFITAVSLLTVFCFNVIKPNTNFTATTEIKPVTSFEFDKYRTFNSSLKIIVKDEKDKKDEKDENDEQDEKENIIFNIFEITQESLLDLLSRLISS